MNTFQKLVLFTALSFIISGCSAPQQHLTTTRADEYVPAFKRIPEGFRPAIPSYSAMVTYLDCAGLDGKQIANIQEKFITQFAAADGGQYGEYNTLIGAIVIDSCGEPAQTKFTIWLLDGRRLDSGYLYMDQKFDLDRLGDIMCAKALPMLQKTIPESRMRAARNALPAGMSKI